MTRWRGPRRSNSSSRAAKRVKEQMEVEYEKARPFGPALRNRNAMREHVARAFARDYGFSVATKSARSPDGVVIVLVTSTEKLFSRSRLRS